MRTGLLTVGLLLLLLPSAYGAGLPRELVVGIPPNGWPPFIIAGAKNQTHGLVIDILREVAAAGQVVLRFRRLPEKRALDLLAKGDIDCWPKAKEWLPEPERFAWSEPMFDTADSFALRRESRVQIRQPADLDGLQIGTHLSYGYPDLEPLFDQGKVERVDAGSELAMLQMLLARRVDTVVIQRQIAEYLMATEAELQGEEIRFAGFAFAAVPYRWMFHDRPELHGFIAYFNQQMERLRRSGRLDQIMSRYR